MSLTQDDLHRVCAAVRDFVGVADWRFKVLPVLRFEFATMNDYARAYHDLIRAHETAAILGNMRKDGRGADFEFANVRVELICNEKVMTKHGPYGAGEVSFKQAFPWPPAPGSDPEEPIG